MSATVEATPLSDLEYRQKTHAILAGIEATVDAWLESCFFRPSPHLKLAPAAAPWLPPPPAARRTPPPS